MRINEKLNLVIPVETDKGTLYVHSTPLSLEAFERYYEMIWKTFTKIISAETSSMGTIGGPRVAALVLKTVATEKGADDAARDALWSAPGGGHELMAELRRLSSVIVPGDKGWEQLPLEDALAQKKIDRQDQSEIESAIVFFIVASAMHKRAMLQEVLDGAATLWDAQITSSNCTAFIASLPKLTAAVNSGAPAAALSVPS